MTAGPTPARRFFLEKMIYEVLKDIQARLTRQEQALKDLSAGQIRIREEINGSRGDIIRQEQRFNDLEVRLDRIDARYAFTHPA